MSIFQTNWASKRFLITTLPFILLGAAGFNKVDESNVAAATEYYVQSNRLPAGAMWFVMVDGYLKDCKGMFRLKPNTSDLYRQGVKEIRLMRPKIAPVEANFRRALRNGSAECRKRRDLILSNPHKNYDITPVR